MSLRRALILASALVLPACDDDDDGGGDGSVQLAANFSGEQASPPVQTAASGVSTFTISPDRSTVNFATTPVNGMTGSAVRLGRTGVNGPLIFDLPAASGVLTADDLRPQPGAASFEEALAAMERGEAFVVVRTAAFPNGEARGQIGPATLIADLDGGATSGGNGSASVSLDETQTRLDFSLDVANLNSFPSSARIQLGPSGPVLFDLSTTPFAGPLSGTLTAADLRPAAGVATFGDAVDALLTGRASIVVPTAASPAGEVSGPLQVSAAPPPPAPPAAPPMTPTGPPPASPLAPPAAAPFTNPFQLPPNPATPSMAPTTPAPVSPFAPPASAPFQNPFLMPTTPSMTPTGPAPVSSFTPPSSAPFTNPFQLPANPTTPSMTPTTSPAVSPFTPPPPAPFPNPASTTTP
jgi:hypothetical protein